MGGGAGPADKKRDLWAIIAGGPQVFEASALSALNMGQDRCRICAENHISADWRPEEDDSDGAGWAGAGETWAPGRQKKGLRTSSNGGPQASKLFSPQRRYHRPNALAGQ
jgi:hypothetical protein